MALGGIFVSLVGWSIVTFGWRATAFASGVIAIVDRLPLAMVMRRRPEDHGETRRRPCPRAGQRDGRRRMRHPTRDFTAREALRTRAFWLISLGHGFALFVVGAVNVHAITHMKEGLGYSLARAALVITLVTVCQIGGVLIGWVIGDRFEKRMIAAACMLMHSSGCSCSRMRRACRG